MGRQLPIENIFETARKVRKTGFFTTLGSQPARGFARMGALLVSGPDAASFLHSQVTNEVKALGPGEGNLSARVNRLGQLVELFSLHRLPDEVSGSPQYMLLVERDRAPLLREDFERFHFSEDVRIEEGSDRFEWVLLQGPLSTTAAENAWGKLRKKDWSGLPENSVCLFPGEDNRTAVLVFVRSLTGDPGFVFAIPHGSRSNPAIWGDLEKAAAALGLLKLEGEELTEALEILRIEAGWVRVGFDVKPLDRVLPETGLEPQVVSYTKGCYLGQEVIARIRTYGSVPVALRGLLLDSSSSDDPLGSHRATLRKLPESGADIVLEDGKAVGRIASRTVSPVLGRPVAYAFLDREDRTPGATLRFRGTDGLVSAQVVLLPFYRGRDAGSRVAFLHDQAVRLFAEGKDRRAVELLEEALRVDPSFVDGYEALGVILGRYERFHEAIDIFRRLEELAPEEPMVNTNLSLYYMKIGDKTKAEEEKAKAAVKRFRRPRTGQAGVSAEGKPEELAAEEEARKKQDAEAKKKMFLEVLEIDPEDPVALFGLGTALSGLGDWAGAETALGKASKVDQNHSAVYLAWGKALAELGRAEEALEVFRKGIEVASRKGDLMPLKEMENRIFLLEASRPPEEKREGFDV